MRLNRKSFLRFASLLAASSISESDALAAKYEIRNYSGSVAPDDENYWRNVRELFPLSKERVYLNNGTMGPSPSVVIDAMNEGMKRNDVEGEYSGYEKSKGAIARLVNVAEEEIALTHNVTEGINIACWGVPLKACDEVILTTHEHVGNALPWLNRQKLQGIVIKTFTPAPTAAQTIERIKSLITPRTKVIAVPHVPCTQGQVLPVKDICTLASQLGIYSIIDGAHGPGMLDMDLREIGCDTYASCCHKWMLGPKGTGFLYVRSGFGSILQPYFVGGGSDKGDWDVTQFPAVMATYSDTAHRYYGGTQSLPLAKGVIASVEFLEDIGMQNVTNRVKYLGQYTQQQLLSLGDRINLLTPTEEGSYCGINGFTIDGVDYKAFFKKAMENGVRIRAVPENGLNCLRVSTHIYNSPEDVDALIALVKKEIT